MRHSLLTVAVLGLGILAACELPSAPRWDIGVVVPYTSDTVSALDFVPSTVSVDTVGVTPVFATQPHADSVEFRLGGMCSLCQELDGLTVQVPSFEFTDSLDVPFPNDLVTIHVISALLEIRVTNGLNFDPLRPDPDPVDAGYIALVARDIATGTTIDSVLIGGADETMIPGETETFQIGITDMEISGGIRIVFHIVSPQDNQTVTIDTNLGTEVAVLLESLQVSSVSVVVDDRTLDEQGQTPVDQKVREELASRAQGGTFELDLQHNLDLQGVLQISIVGSPADLFSADPTREVALNQLVLTPDLAQTRELTVEQIQRIATFENVHIGYKAIASGTDTGPSGESNVARFTPEQFLLVNLRLRSFRRVEF